MRRVFDQDIRCLASTERTEHVRCEFRGRRELQPAHRDLLRRLPTVFGLPWRYLPRHRLQDLILLKFMELIDSNVSLWEVRDDFQLTTHSFDVLT